MPASSEKVYITVVIPIGKLSPDWCVCVLVTGNPELSVAVGSVQVTTRVDTPNGTVRLVDAGQKVMVGTVVSPATTENINCMISLL